MKNIKTKGIILAGGAGTRMHPVTKVVSKQLLPIYDKPTIYYPLSVLLLAGIEEVLIISTPEDLPRFEKLFGDGSFIGIRVYYEEQPEPRGLAQAFIIGENYIGKDKVCLILGDNLFYGNNLFGHLKNAINVKKGGVIFGYRVASPNRYGVVEFDGKGKAVSIEEKPKKPKSNYAVPGLYFYDNNVIEIARNLIPSSRGELEITDVNLAYLKNQQLTVEVMGRGLAWLDTGTPSSLLKASMFVEAIETRQGYKIGCIEEIAWRQNLIDDLKLKEIGEAMGINSEYGKYLLALLSE